MAKFFDGTDAEWNELMLRAVSVEYSGMFLQSSVWARVTAARGHLCARVLDDAGNPSLWIALRIKPFVWVWYCPKGPIIMPQDEKEMHEIILLLQTKKHAAVLRIEPPHEISLAEFHKRRDISPAHTLVTNIDQADDELLKNFHEKTRYNIRVAEKHGVEVVRLSGESLAMHSEGIINLFLATGARHEIQSLPREELRALFDVCDVWGAFFDGRLIATSLHLGFGHTMTYVHGASRYEDRAVMAPHALHWAVMRDARDRGSFTRYDWWGIAPEGDVSHRLMGVTRFKVGFDGVRENAPGTFDRGIDRTLHALYTFASRIGRRS